ncbi:hypothetical protein LTR08_005350 [Meristemomyces frigidus]|nr:hypothetical protein LTR08_005350 [Meristemomyces frigidus]
MATSVNTTYSYPLGLHYIKALCVQKHYRQCIQACRDIMKNTDSALDNQPAQQTFVRFYLGLAHDELARLMHDYNQAKVAAFNQAEQHYKEALETLSAIEGEHDATPKVSMPVPDETDPFFDSSSERSNSPSSPTPRLSDEYDPYNYSSPSFSSSPPTASHPHMQGGSFPARSPRTASRKSSASDLSDLESHSSFHQIMTPHKLLHRDISRMSLLDDLPAKRPTGLPRTTSTSQGLLRPIRPGSPPKAFYVPPRLPYFGDVARIKSRLPKLVTRGTTRESPKRPLLGTARRYSRLPLPLQRSVTRGMISELPPKQEMPRAIWEEEAPAEPVSPMGSDGVISQTSAVSPVSRDTPTHPAAERCRTSHEITGAEDTENERDGHNQRVTEHLLAMRNQLQSHIARLESARQATLTAQATEISKRASACAPTNGTPLPPLWASMDGASSGSRPSSSVSGRQNSSYLDSKHDSIVGGDGKRLTLAKNFPSFTSEQVMAEEKQKKIQAERERGWVRERFQAKRYQELAEKALAEL